MGYAGVGRRPGASVRGRGCRGRGSWRPPGVGPPAPGRRVAGRRRGRATAAGRAARHRGHVRLLSFDSSCPAAPAGLSPRELLAQLLPRAVQPDARRVGRDAEDLGDLGGRQLLPGPQPEQLGVLLAQGGQRRRRGRGRRPVRPDPAWPRPAGRRPRSGPRAAPGGVRRAGRWPGSCGPRRRPTAAGPRAGRPAGASRPAASRRGRRRRWRGRYAGPGSAAAARRAWARPPRTSPSRASPTTVLTVSHVRQRARSFVPADPSCRRAVPDSPHGRDATHPS